MKERDTYFDNLKGFLIIMVIVGNTLEEATIKNLNIHFLILFLYIFHMPLFAFISGYFSKMSSRKTIHKVRDTFKIYLLAQVFYTFFAYFILGSKDVKMQILMPRWTLWYLLSLVCWYILSDYIKNKKAWLIGSIIVSLLVGFDPSVGTTASVSRTLFFLPFFILGLSFDRKHVEKIKEKKWIVYIGTIITVGGLYIFNETVPIELFFEYARYTWYFNQPWFPFVMRIYHYVVAFFLGATILSFKWEKANILKNIGKLSLIMYISHSGIDQLLLKFGLLRYDSWISLILSTISVVLIVILFTFGYVKVKSYIKGKIKYKNI